MRVSSLFQRICGDRLLNGPFRGMRYVRTSIGSSFGAKLIGTYELELAGVIEELCRRGFREVVNIGAGEGHYAVGLAFRQPGALVTAFEMDTEGQALIGL